MKKKLKKNKYMYIKTNEFSIVYLQKYSIGCEAFKINL
jgi:hypothetical protein